MYRQINRDLYGITSLIFVLTALILADIALFENSILLGIIYAIIILALNFMLLYTFCAKCPCKNHCGHIIPGRIALLFKNRPVGKYTKAEKLTAAVLIILLIGLPQIWLWKGADFFFAFWILLIAGTIQIRTVICKNCQNSFCPVNSNFKHA